MISLKSKLMLEQHCDALGGRLMLVGSDVGLFCVIFGVGIDEVGLFDAVFAFGVDSLLHDLVWL